MKRKGEEEKEMGGGRRRSAVAVAIDRPVIKNQLTSQLPCESEPIKCA